MREVNSSPGRIKHFRENLATFALPVMDDHAFGALRANGANGTALETVETRLNLFYKLYEECFPLTEELQPISGYQHILTKSHFDSEVTKVIQADHREFLYILRDPYTKKPIGGLDFVVYSHHEAPPTVHSCFAFLTAENHGLKLARKMFDIRDEIVMHHLFKTNRSALEKNGGFFTFSEQNIAERMDIGSYWLDSTTIDPIKRLLIWSHIAYSAVEMPKGCSYIQPPYIKGGKTCTILGKNTYFRKVVINGNECRLGELVRPEFVPASLFYRHLRALCVQNFVKDVHAETTDPTTQSMLSQFRASGMDALRVVPERERTEHLRLWQDRIEALSRIFLHTRFDRNRIIGDLYEENKALVTHTLRKASKKPVFVQVLPNFSRDSMVL